MAKLLTEAELAQLITAAVLAERAACAATCAGAAETLNMTVHERGAALACMLAIHRRTIDGAVSNNDTPAHETPQSNGS